LVWLVSLKDGSRLRGRTSGISEVIHKKVGVFKCGFGPPAQAPPQRGFCPGGRALWLGEISDCGIEN